MGRPNTLVEAEQLAAAAVQPSTRRLLASKKNATEKASSKPKKDKKKQVDAEPTDAERAIGAASFGGHDDWYNDDTGDWYFGNTGGFYSYVPRPLLNTWVVSKPRAGVGQLPANAVGVCLVAVLLRCCP